MDIHTGRFHNWRKHHERWLSVFCFGGKNLEIWFGNRWLSIWR